MSSAKLRREKPMHSPITPPNEAEIIWYICYEFIKLENVSLGEKVTYDVNKAKQLIPRVLDNTELLEVNVDHTGIVLQLLNVPPVFDKSRLVFEERLFQCAVKK